MSANESRTVTEREAVLREREAVAKTRCVTLWANESRSPHNPVGEGPCAECVRVAKALHPLPTKTVPREDAFTFGSGETHHFRVRNGVLESRPMSCERWLSYGMLSVNAHTPAFLRFLADLKEHPTREVSE